MTINPENTGESRLLFFSRERLGGAASAKEKQIQAEIAKEKPEKKDKPDDIVDETEVNAKFDAIEGKIKASPVAEKHKETIRGKLGKLVDTWKGKIDAVGKKAADKLKAVWAKTNEALAKFNERKDVVDIYQTLEPLYDKTGKPKGAIVKSISLTTYRKKSGECDKINKNLAAAGFPEDKIKPLQGMLGVRVDGKVGPETINAMSAMLGLSVKVEFADETKYVGEEKSEEQKEAEANPKPAAEAGAAGEGEVKAGEKPGGAGTEAVPVEAEAKGVAEEGEPGYTPGVGEEQDQTLVDAEAEPVDGERAPLEMSKPVEKLKKPIDSFQNPDGTNYDAPAGMYYDGKEWKKVTPEEAKALKQPDAVELGEVQGEESGEKPEGKEFSKEALEAMKIPLSFTFLNKTLKLSKVALTRYFVAYENCDINKAIPIGQIWKKLDDISNRYLKGLDAKTTQAALVHAFGKLVNGYDEKLVPDQILLLNVVKVGEKVKGIVEKRSDKEVLLSAQLEVRDAEVKHLGKLVKENPNFAQFWKDSNEPQIEKTLKALERHNADIAKLEGGIASLNGEIKALTTSSFVSQYQYLLNGGKDTRAVLLRMHDSFGDDVPDFIKPKIKEVLGGIQEDPNASEFHKLFYAGKYEEALRLLAKENDDRNKVPGIQGHMGLHDYVAAYRKYKDNPKIAKLARMFKANGSYAGKKIEEGYLPIPINRREDRRGRVKYQILLVRENPDGSLNHLCVQDNGDQIGAYPDAPPIVQNFGAEHVITAEKMQEMENSDKAMKEKISMVIGKSPSFKAVRNAGAILNRQLGPMQSLFQSGMQGNKTEGFVNMLKVEAGKLRGSKAIGQLRGNLAQARKELSALRSFSDAGMKDQFEKQIAQLEKQLSSITRIVEGSKINSICDRILDKDFDVDDFGRWALKTGLPWLVTIVAATAAVVITLSTFGAGTPAGLALVAAVGVKGVGLATAATAAFVGTAAGMAANELVSAGTHVAGQAIYGDEFSNKTMLGKYITDEKVYNPKTDKYEKLEGSTVAKVYGKQFAMGFVTTFAMVGLGQLAGTYLAKFAAANLESASVAKSAAARLLQKIPRLGPQTVDVMKQHGLESMTRKVFKEALEELGEEGAQTVGERIDPKLGFLVSMYSCLNGGSMEYKLGEYDVVAEGSSAKGNRAETAWSYDASKTQEFVAKLEGEYSQPNIAKPLGVLRSVFME